MAAEIPWEQGWEQAAFGPFGFYRQQSPYDHFTTSVEQATLVNDLLPYLRASLDHGPVAIVDVGAGSGLLTEQLLASLEQQERARVQAYCLDLRARPTSLSPDIHWIQGDIRETISSIPRGNCMLIAHEFLDDIPCAIVEADANTFPHLLAVNPQSQQAMLGPALTSDSDEARWLREWWPVERPLMRAEVGKTRDHIWQQLTAVVATGFAIAIDYGHLRADRARGLMDAGTLSGYVNGQPCTPRADTTINLTAHVAMDSVAAASSGSPTIQLMQRGPTPDFWWLVAAYGIKVPEPARMSQ